MSFWDTGNRQVSGLDRTLEIVVRELETAIAAMLAEMSVKNGRIVMGADNLITAASMTPALRKALRESGFVQAIQAFQNMDAQFLGAVKGGSLVPMKFARPSIEVIQKLRDLQFQKFGHIGEAAMEKVREAVIQTIQHQIPIRDTLTDIRAVLDKDLRSYARTYAQTTRHDLIQIMQDEALRDVPDDEQFFWYEGPEDDKTRDACLFLLSIGYFTKAERDQYDAETAGDRAYNCRHNFMAVPASLYAKRKGELGEDGRLKFQNDEGGRRRERAAEARQVYGG